MASGLGRMDLVEVARMDLTAADMVTLGSRPLSEVLLLWVRLGWMSLALEHVLSHQEFLVCQAKRDSTLQDKHILLSSFHYLHLSS